MIKKNNILKISFIISICIHLICGILIYILLEKYQDKNIPKEKKVKLAFKRGGDSAKKDSTFKENTPLPKKIPQPQAQQASQPAQKQRIQEPKPNITPQAEQPKKIDKQIDLSRLQIYDQSNTQIDTSQSIPQSTSQQNNVTQMLQNLPQDVREEISDLYGDELGDYGEAERDFIINNLRDIGRITQYHLNLRGYPPDAGYLGQQGKNAVEFYLYPNGDISDLHIILDSKSMILDKNTIKTIEIAYKDYPHPSTKTKIKIYVRYYLFGY